MKTPLSPPTVLENSCMGIAQFTLTALPTLLCRPFLPCCRSWHFSSPHVCCGTLKEEKSVFVRYRESLSQHQHPPSLSSSISSSTEPSEEQQSHFRRCSEAVIPRTPAHSFHVHKLFCSKPPEHEGRAQKSTVARSSPHASLDRPTEASDDS